MFTLLDRRLCNVYARAFATAQQQTYSRSVLQQQKHFRNGHPENALASDRFLTMRDYAMNSGAQNYGSHLLSQMIAKCAPEISSICKKECMTKSLNAVEFGCATGTSSLLPIDAIRKAVGPTTDVNIVMNDLPLNDWGELSKTISTNCPPQVSFDISSQSMYDDIVAPTQSVDLAYSCFAQHWLSGGVPCHLPAETGAIWGNQMSSVPGGTDIQRIWAESSRKDWERFLELRANEVRIGGIVVLLIQSAFLDGTLNEGFAHVCQVAKKQCLEEGIFTKDEAERMCMPEYMKTAFEILQPLQRNPHRTKWEVLQMDHRIAPCVVTDENVFSSNANKSATEKASEIVEFLKSFMSSSLENSLNAERSSIKLQQFWDKVFQIILKDPAKSDTSWAITMLALKRKK